MAIVVSMLSVENLFFTPRKEQELADSKRRVFASVYGDHLTLLNIYKACVRVRLRSMFQVGQKPGPGVHPSMYPRSAC